MKSFLLAVQFLTRLPLPMNTSNEPKLIGRSLLWYPLVGIFIGVLLYGAAMLLHNQSPLFTAAIVLIFWVLITGGLHLDGLADSADAWAGGYGDKQKSLDIMKDPHVGSFAVVVLGLVLLLKFVAFGELLKSEKMPYLVLAPMLARSAVVYLFLTTPYVRANGLGSDMAQHLPQRAAIVVLLLFILPALFFQPVAVLGAFLMLMVLRYLMMKRIAGMTGDTLGASIEIIEAAVLVTVVMM